MRLTLVDNSFSPELLKQLVEQMSATRSNDHSRVAAYVLGALKDAALTTDVRGRIIYLNPSAERLTGWRSAETRGLTRRE